MEQENLYLLASEGERHEDAIPDGVYTLDGLKALKYIPIDQNWDDIISEAGDKWLYFYIIDNGQIDDEYQATEEEKEKIMCGDHDKDWLKESLEISWVKKRS